MVVSPLLVWLSVSTAIFLLVIAAALLVSRQRLKKRVGDTEGKLTLHRRHLEILSNLTAALNKATDVEKVQQVVLNTLTIELGYACVVLGLVDDTGESITGWIGRTSHKEGYSQLNLTHTTNLSLQAQKTPIATAIESKKIQPISPEKESRPNWLYESIRLEKGFVVPLIWGVRPVGAVLIESEDPLDASLERVLTSLAQQTAVALNTLATRVRRAKESAITDERARIALDLHDTVSQTMFGIVFTLDSCLKMWPTRAEEIEPELTRTLEAAKKVQREIRQLIHNL